jgi:hypothetical protein
MTLSSSPIRAAARASTPAMAPGERHLSTTTPGRCGEAPVQFRIRERADRGQEQVHALLEHCFAIGAHRLVACTLTTSGSYLAQLGYRGHDAHSRRDFGAGCLRPCGTHQHRPDGTDAGTREDQTADCADADQRHSGER